MAYSIVRFISFAFEIYFWLIIIRIIFSWIQVSRTSNEFLSQFESFVYTITEPYLGLFRSFIPIVSLGGGGLDLSPIVALFVLQLIKGVIINLISAIL